MWTDITYCTERSRRTRSWCPVVAGTIRRPARAARSAGGPGRDYLARSGLMCNQVNAGLWS
ncbi:hypothetical protein Pfl04_48870 [Planosporangium flavigriseum]|uniref:Uncharacterized protein n=1 Tax=Planosporangium flavigriseum TaxID=373681 RepID=A0A8J3LTX7_9ACTN|nr:hypothetical protein Pfl04_48870 [Planosporangium flavigriseum]